MALRMTVSSSTGEHDNCNCHHSSVNPSVHQTLDELDFERGLWSSALLGDVSDVERKLEQDGTKVNKVDKSGYTPLHYACRNGHLKVCQVLLAYQADVNSTTQSSKATPLHRAAYMGHSLIVSLLLEAGANPAVVDCDGMTPLHKATENGHIETAEILFEACRTAASTVDNKGRKPVDLAISEKLKAKLNS